MYKIVMENKNLTFATVTAEMNTVLQIPSAPKQYKGNTTSMVFMDKLPFPNGYH